MAEGSGAHPLSPVVRKVASATRKLMRSSGFPSDIEWVWDGKKLWFLQLRRITGETRLTTYSSRMAGEMLPGQIKPLVWSVNIPLVVGAKTALLEEITGPLPVKPGELVRSFYYRTYFNMDKLGEILSCVGLPVESPENVMRGDHHHMSGFRPGWKTIRHARRLIRFVRQKLKYPVLFEQEYRKLKENTQALQLELQEEFQPSRYSLLFDKLYSNAQRLAHFNIVIPLLMRIYTNRLRKKMEKAAIPFDQNRFNEVFPELTVLSPSGLMDTIRKAWKDLSPTVKNGISHPGDLQFHPETTSLAADFGLLMEKFGHFSRSGNDFSNPKWEEDPAGVWNMIIGLPVNEEDIEAGSSGEKSRNADGRAEKIIGAPPAGEGGRFPRKLEKLWRKAGRLMVYREQISSLYIYGYGLFRTLFLQTGEWLTRQGLLADREELFFLTREEVESAILNPEDKKMQAYPSEIARRKKEMEESRDFILPAEIYGEKAPLITRGSIRSFSGTGVSAGTYRGKARILLQESDFTSVSRGDVLVIPFSDVSWTPVLVKAGAIVSESGGMLSHCAIVARELGIPALVSVDHACSIEQGSLVTVDGSNGLLTLHDHE